MEKAGEKAMYEGIVEKCKAWGYNLMRTYDGLNYTKRQAYREGIEGLQDIETDFLFNNQYNTASGYRVHDWKESIVPNKDIIVGHYIVYSEELAQAKKDQYVCGYCGARYHKPNRLFCNKCLGSKYLTEKELYLLALVPVSEDRIGASERRNEISEDLREDYRKAQATHKVEFKKQQQKRRLKLIEEMGVNLEKEINGLREEAELKIAVLRADYDIDNFIVYSGKGPTFGWRESLKNNQEEVAKIDSLNLPFVYTIK
jgi:hypothetical protein